MPDPFLTSGIATLRSVEWGRSYLWDCRFVGPDRTPPPPFDSWFPATDVDDNIFNLEYYEIPQYNTKIRLPMGTSPFELRVTFPDDINNTLLNWLERWVHGAGGGLDAAPGILNSGGGQSYTVGLLADICRTFQIAKLDKGREPIDVRTLAVYPDQSFWYAGRSESGVHLYQGVFQVAGLLRNDATSPF